MYRTAVYTRAVGEQSSTILTQKKAIEEYVVKKGWNLPRLYIDRKGSTGERSELMRLMDDVKNGQIDVLVVDDITRLSRNEKEVSSILNLLDEKGVQITSLDGTINMLEEVDEESTSNKSKQNNNNMGEQTMKIAAYTRVAGQQASAILIQKGQIENYVMSKGWNLPKLYIDRKVGTESERPELERLIEDVKNGQINILVVDDITRLSRNQGVINTLLNLLDEKGVELVSLAKVNNPFSQDLNGFSIN